MILLNSSYVNNLGSNLTSTHFEREREREREREQLSCCTNTLQKKDALKPLICSIKAFDM